MKVFEEKASSCMQNGFNRMCGFNVMDQSFSSIGKTQ